MSNVPTETIDVIAQSVGINNLSPDVAFSLAPHVEFVFGRSCRGDGQSCILREITIENLRGSTKRLLYGVQPPTKLEMTQLIATPFHALYWLSLLHFCEELPRSTPV
ncbi:hypothetical protein MKX01_013948 [Papaver californicum]|nr:hypothetical protein MKX01_013948 [Papaver californicum]